MHELELRLQAAAADYPFPATPDLAGAVRARLSERRRRSRGRRAVAFAVALAAVAGAVLTLSPGARSGAVDLLDRIPGIHIERRIRSRWAGSTSAPYYGIEMPLGAQAASAGRSPAAGARRAERACTWLQYPPGDMITAIYGGDDRRAELVFSQWKRSVPTTLYKSLG